MLRQLGIHRSLLVAAAAAVALMACSDSGTPTGTATVAASPLAGLTGVSSNDSSGTSGGVAQGPGYFHGTVMGPAVPGAGNDSLRTSPRIAGVTVTIYPKLSSSPNDLGPAAGSTVTNASGEFQLPTLPAGEYAVTFVPPATSGYNGVYVSGPLRSTSSQYPWWVTLTKK